MMVYLINISLKSDFIQGLGDFESFPATYFNRLVHQNEFSDHDLAYIITNIKKPRFEPRYKIQRNEKNFNLKSYIDDFSKNST